MTTKSQPGTAWRIGLLCLIPFAAVACNDSSSGSGGGQNKVAINEVMARNRSVVVVDDSGQPIVQDWVEVYNGGKSTIALSRFTLTDNQNRPDKFRFPRSATLAPDSFMIVYVFNRESCRPECATERDECLARPPGVSLTLDEVAECDQEFDRCLASCEPSGPVADFGLGSNDNVFLYTDDGETLIDQVGVRNPERDLTVGRFPDGTGDFGVIYAGATPGAHNLPTNLGSVLVEDDYVVSPSIPGCDELVDVEFSVVLDTDQQADLSLKLEYAEADCGMAPPDAGYRDDGVSLVLFSEEVLESETRVDINSATVVEARSRFVYRGVLPGAPCGVSRRVRVNATIDSLVETKGLGCFTWNTGQTLPTVVINEYMTKNDSLQFTLKREENTVDPDWFELYNYGSEPVDISTFGVVGLNRFNDFQNGDEPNLDPWLFINPNAQYDVCGESPDFPCLAEAPDQVVLDPGCFLVVLADNRNERNDPQPFRPAYRSVGGIRGDLTCQIQDSNGPIFFSTDIVFRLDGGNPDGFVLVDGSGRELDRMVIRLDDVPPEFLELNDQGEEDVKADISFGRNSRELESDESYRRPLSPGAVLCVPTPGGDNTVICQVGPRFGGLVTLYPRNPIASDAVSVEAQVNFDEDTPEGEDLIVELHYMTDSDPEPQILSVGSGLVLTRATDQGGAVAASQLYDVRAEIPPQLDGTLVTFFLLARDAALARDPTAEADPEVVYGDTPDAEVSFRYLVGFEPGPGAPVINEILPRNEAIPLPPFVEAGEARFPDYVEFHNPGDEPLDLSGYYLAQENFPESGSSRIRRAREWPFPPGAVIPPGGLVTAYFGPPPTPISEAYIEIDAFDPACEETLYLIAPDDPERGANSIVDSLSWNLRVPATEDEVASCRGDVSIGRVCDGFSPFQEMVPTPEQPNFESMLAPIFHSAYHSDIVGNTNRCMDQPFVTLNAVVFLDEAVLAALDPDPEGSNPNFTIESASFLVDLGDGLEESLDASVVAFDCDRGGGRCEPSPDGYSSVRFDVLLNTAGKEVGPAVFYRLLAVDVCGNRIESGVSSFGTGVAEKPALAINELNRAFPLLDEAEASPRRWLELMNMSETETIDAGGMFLTTNEQFPQMFELAAGLNLEPGAFVVVPLDGDGDDLALEESGEILLIDSVLRGSCIVDRLSFDFDGLAPETSLGRRPDGTGDVEVLEQPSPGSMNAATRFIRGDVTEDAEVNVTDMIRLLLLLFSGDPRRPECEDAMDVDDSGSVDLADPIFLGNFVFGGDQPIPAPFPQPGTDPTPDNLQECGAGP